MLAALVGAALALVAHPCVTHAAPAADGVHGAFSDWKADAPGVRHRVTLGDLPPPYATASAVNPAEIIARPHDAWPKAPPHFRVDLLVSGLQSPRQIRIAPDGDVFVAESTAGRIRVLRFGRDGSHVSENTLFASGLTLPFGIAFYPPGPEPRYVYVANTDSVVRFPYRNGDLKARGPAERVVSEIPGYGAHWTRDIVFSADGGRMFIAVGSASNVQENPRVSEKLRADILTCSADGTGLRVYASGIRNPAGLAIDPATGQLWCAVNERDGLGDNLVPDYVTHVTQDGFYGWPWFYLGAHRDPRHPRGHQGLMSKAIVPDVLIASHSAPLGVTFYGASAFPKEYRGCAFVTLHGSWNRSRRTGYKVISVPMRDGAAGGEYYDFVTGFITPDGKVWGRPVGVAVARDGSLLITDDASNSLWRVSYQPERAR